MANTQQQQPVEREAGRWYETKNGELNQWEAACGKCGKVVPAVKLKLKIRPFGKGERWECGNC